MQAFSVKGYLSNTLKIFFELLPTREMYHKNIDALCRLLQLGQCRYTEFTKRLGHGNTELGERTKPQPPPGQISQIIS